MPNVSNLIKTIQDIMRKDAGVDGDAQRLAQLGWMFFLKIFDDRETQLELFDDAYRSPLAKHLRWRTWASDAEGITGDALLDFVNNTLLPKLKSLPGGSEIGTLIRAAFDGANNYMKNGTLMRQVINKINGIDFNSTDDRHLFGDIYEKLLKDLQSAGNAGEFYTPRAVTQFIVEQVNPRLDRRETVLDPACGTGGFLVAAGEYLRDRHPEILRDAKLKKHFHEDAFHGFDFDNTMLRIGSMNMLLHGVENPDIRYRDSLGQDHAGEEEKYTLILANPPFAGSLDYENCAKDLLTVVKTKKTELLFLALFLRLLKPGGRAAVIVPDGVLFGSSNAHKTLRQLLVEEQKLDAVISLPGGVFKPYAGVSTAILLFTKTNSGGTDHVWFYDVDADGKSLDDKRADLVPEEKFGPVPRVALSADDHAKNNLPDILARWAKRDGAERQNPRTAQSFCVPKADIAAQGYDLSLNRYKEVVHAEVAHRPPGEILNALEKLEAEIQQGMKELEGMLK